MSLIAGFKRMLDPLEGYKKEVVEEVKEELEWELRDSGVEMGPNDFFFNNRDLSLKDPYYIKYVLAQNAKRPFHIFYETGLNAEEIEDLAATIDERTNLVAVPFLEYLFITRKSLWRQMQKERTDLY